ncbi:hypothetical protein BGZ76_006917 [Entomortierella beljakovae]|nr:hypothetical protein BGZ76_006917 [Entomortierella beljakovae]
MFPVVTESNDRGLQQLQHTFAPSGLSLAGVCTVRIEPHIFIDTKFYTPNNIAASNRSSADTISDVKHNQEKELQHQTPNNVSQPQVVMEFKENPHVFWIFPDDSSLEFIPGDDRESAQITASFYLPLHDKTDSPPNPKYDTTRPMATIVIQRPTAALREGLGLAINGSLDKTKTTIATTTTTTATNTTTTPTSRRQNLSTYSEEPSEILGSRRQSTNGNSTINTINSSKRKTEIAAKSKSKRPRDHDDKAPHSKKSTGAGSKKTGATGTSSVPTPQKRCGYCDCTSTPMWRRGPNGPSTLCNACGVKWKHGKILQGPNDTNMTQKSSSVTSTTSNNRHPNLKTAKESSSAVVTSPADDIGTHKINSRKSNHGLTLNESNEKSYPRENGGSRSHEGERMIPVKKRLLGKVASINSPGPRMVPVHELGDPTKTPSKFPPLSRKHSYDNSEPPISNGRIKHPRNGFERHDTLADGVSISSSSATSSLTENNEFGCESNNREESSAPSISDESLSLYSKNRYTNNTATFPLHFPTISIGFGPNNAHFKYPNCAMALYENHFQIKLIQDGERTEIDVWKEGIERTEFNAVDVGDGESMITMKALLRQYLTRFDKELLNPDRDESLIVFRFRERLDGGGPSVKPLLLHWLATDIPVPPPSQ